MSIVYGFVIVCCLVAALMAAWRVATGPRHPDRIVALDILLAAALGLCILASLVSGRSVFIDVGVGLALVGFVATIGWARLLDRAEPGHSEANPKP